MNSATLKIIDTIAILFAQSYLLARSRLASYPSPLVRLQALRDHVALDARLLERAVDVFRSQRVTMKPHQRPHYAPAQRLEILQIMRLRGWNAIQAAEYFVLHPNTIRTWVKAINNRDSRRLLGGPAWNRLHEAVRWTVQELRRMLPDPALGIRTIARHLARAGVQVSSSSVRRILQEDPAPPPRRRPPLNPPQGVRSHHLLKPTKINRVWHLDLCTLRLLWMRFTIAALLDGCSRKLLVLKVYRGAARRCQMILLMRRAVHEYGRPQFLITDHGCQFRKPFTDQIKAIGIRHVRGKVRSPAFNGKVERLFRTLRGWLRLMLLPIGIKGFRGLQRRLDCFRDWYNQERPHAALAGRTPEQAWSGLDPPEPIPIRQNDPVEPRIQVRRRGHGGDPYLPVVNITVRWRIQPAA